MKISNFSLTREEDNINASALVQFEDGCQPDRQVYIKTPKIYEKDFSANPNAFLVGCLLPAIHLKEFILRKNEFILMKRSVLFLKRDFMLP